MSGHRSAERHAECCICFDDLCAEPVAVFVDKNRKKRVCCHYFHFECVKDMCPFVTRGYGLEMEVENTGEGMMKCPMCRAEFNRVVKMPDPVKDPGSWFRLVDTKGSGSLTKEEVHHVVRATCKISEERVSELIDARWRTWDTDDSGSLSQSELPNLLNFMRRNQDSAPQLEPPHIVEDKEGWFLYWDEDASGRLEKDEVARALIKTFGKDKRVREMQSIVESVWSIFDITRSNYINKDTFLQADGLADTIIACLQSDTRLSLRAASLYSSPLASPKTPVRTPFEASAWDCPRCTFINSGLAECEMCRSPKPDASLSDSLSSTTGSSTSSGMPACAAAQPRNGLSLASICFSLNA